MDKNLSRALSESLSDEVSSLSTDLFEVGLDAVMDDGILKEVPILATAVSLYKIGNSLKERHYIKKLASFIALLNSGITNEKEREYYKSKVKDNPAVRDKELEYILILIDRYIHFDKAKKLAKLYLDYLDESIDWETFSKASEVLDRLLPGDFQELKKCFWNDLDDSNVSDALLRLVSLGLVISHNKGAHVENTSEMLVFPDSTVKDYELTIFGQTFLWCLSEDYQNEAMRYTS